MIYGQPITFGGGSGNELVVIAPTGSTVTATKGGVTKTTNGENGTWTFKGLEAGTWEITATKDGKVATKTVTFVDEQSVELSTFYKPNFADNDWATIIKLCQSGNVPDTWVAGNSKPMTINGKSYQIDIIGKNHDTYTAGGIAPLTFQLHDCYATTYKMNNAAGNTTGYDGSEMHTTHLPAILNSMPSEVQAAIKPVNKKTGMGNNSTSGVETVSCKLFLLAEIEVVGYAYFSVAGEGSQYDYYKAGNSSIKALNGMLHPWWSRSPRTPSQVDFCYFPDSGGSNGASAGYASGVSFAFCF